MFKKIEKFIQIWENRIADIKNTCLKIEKNSTELIEDSSYLFERIKECNDNIYKLSCTINGLRQDITKAEIIKNVDGMIEERIGVFFKTIIGKEWEQKYTKAYFDKYIKGDLDEKDNFEYNDVRKK